jgi:hypothetical protein
MAVIETISGWWGLVAIVLIPFSPKLFAVYRKITKRPQRF